MAGAITIITTSLTPANAYVAVDVQIEYTGGDGGNTWTLDSGTLPPGVTVGNILEVGRLSGTPTTPGLYSFVVKVADSTTHTDTQSFTWYVGYFPSPTLNGQPYKKFYAAPQAWDEATVSHTYDDGGKSFNRSGTPPLMWVLEIDCPASSHTASKAITDIYDSFWNAVGIDRPFSFIDKYGTTHTNVRVKDYNRSHEENRSWLQSVAFTLIKYP